jgi:hypothetical protein
MKKLSTTKNYILFLLALVISPMITLAQPVQDIFQTGLSPSSNPAGGDAMAATNGNLKANDLGASMFIYGTPTVGAAGVASSSYTLNVSTNGNMSFSVDKAGVYNFDVPVTTLNGVLSSAITIVVDGPVDDGSTLDLANDLNGGFEALSTGNLSANDINAQYTYGAERVGEDGVAGLYTLTVNSDGSYFFDGEAAGNYHFEIPTSTPLGVIYSDLRFTVNGPVPDNVSPSFSQGSSMLVGNLASNDVGGPYTYGSQVQVNQGVGNYAMTVSPNGDFTFSADQMGVYNLEVPVTTNEGVLMSPMVIEVTSPLPVSLANFEAVFTNDKVELDWGTVSEKNASHFSVQRSVDGINFSEVGIVAAVGNSVQEENYSFTDLTLQNILQKYSSVYYRLEQVDMDYTSRLSKIKTINFSSLVDKITVLPNPTRGQVKLTNWENVENITVVNSMGQVVYSDKAVSGSTVNLNGNVAGVYLVIIQTADGEKITESLQVVN